MDSKEVLAVHSMLHLIFHRNKNQHHRAKWWKWLSMLKRATADLARSRETGAVETQKQHLAAHIIPRCYMYDPSS
jgi:ribonuclease MRP protein subunit RMP1